MPARHRVWRPLAALLLLAFIAGCVGKSEPSRYYVLEASVPYAERNPDGAAVSVGPVTLPKYLDRPQVVTRPSPTQLDVSEFDRWGGRLEDNVAQVLAEDIGRRLRTARVAVFPNEPAGRADVRIGVTITRFERVGSEGDVVLDARWRITRPTAESDVEPVRGNFTVTKHANSAAMPATVEAMSSALSDLSATLAEAVTRSGHGA
jgi:uncharacterized lipoprotein YmbA